jgi:hypothetical protein
VHVNSQSLVYRQHNHCTYLTLQSLAHGRKHIKYAVQHTRCLHCTAISSLEQESKWTLLAHRMRLLDAQYIGGLCARQTLSKARLTNHGEENRAATSLVYAKACMPACKRASACICTATFSVNEEPEWYASLDKRYDGGKGDARRKLSMCRGSV